MKSTMPFRGVMKPARDSLCKELFAAHPLASFAAWRDTSLSLWRSASHREDRYVAMDLLLSSGARYAAHAESLEALPVYEELVVSGAWWDYVDLLAARGLGAILKRNPEPARKALLEWSACGDMWKRRAAVIAQLNIKGSALDKPLLYAAIGNNLLGSTFGGEFFIQKAIGWALRQRAREAAEEVRAFVREREGELAPLSRREALKRVGAGAEEDGDDGADGASGEEEAEAEETTTTPAAGRKRRAAEAATAAAASGGGGRGKRRRGGAGGGGAG